MLRKGVVVKAQAATTWIFVRSWVVSSCMLHRIPRVAPTDCDVIQERLSPAKDGSR